MSKHSTDGYVSIEDMVSNVVPLGDYVALVTEIVGGRLKNEKATPYADFKIEIKSGDGDFEGKEKQSMRYFLSEGGRKVLGRHLIKCGVRGVRFPQDTEADGYVDRFTAVLEPLVGKTLKLHNEPEADETTGNEYNRFTIVGTASGESISLDGAYASSI